MWRRGSAKERTAEHDDVTPVQLVSLVHACELSCGDARLEVRLRALRIAAREGQQ